MGDVKPLDHIDTGIIESRGYKLNKVFTTGSNSDVLTVQDEAMNYAEQLAEKHEVGVRPISVGDHFYIDVYILE